MPRNMNPAPGEPAIPALPPLCAGAAAGDGAIDEFRASVS